MLVERWVTFFNRAYEIDRNKIPKELEEDENIKKAVEKLDIMYLDKEEREIYENDLKALRIHKAEIKTAEEKGIQRGAILSRREDILENLGEVATLTDNIIKIVNEENNIETLKKWLKISMMVGSLEDFIRKINAEY